MAAISTKPNYTTQTFNKTRPVALKDIASDLNVSLSLVSKVLSGRLGTTKVRDEVRNAILKRAEELNYRPNTLATALQSGRTGTIGLIVHPTGVPGSELFDRFLRGASCVLEAQNLRLWLRFFDDTGGFYADWSKYSSREVDGVIVAGVRHREMDEFLQRWSANGLPVVTAFADEYVEGIPNVGTDHRAQAYVATDYLIKNGCSRVAYVSTIESRRLGYEAALKDNGIPYDPALIRKFRYFETRHGSESVRHWIKEGIAFDGLVAQSDPMAQAALNELYRNNMRVPQDIQVVGIDNSPLCEISEPTLSSATSEMSSVGIRAVEKVLAMLDGEQVESESIQPKVIARGSTLPIAT